MAEITLACFAKVNLSLCVLEKRPDGYHDLETVFQSVGLADRLRLRETGGDQVTIECSYPGVPLDRSNLCWRAAELMRSRYAAGRGNPALQFGLEIEIEKTIPPQAGLGGGSSDAAATLVGLNLLWRLGLEPEELEKLAAELGSDVSFFVRGGTAIGRGRGERLERLPPPGRLWFVLARPNFGISTSWAYGQLEGERRPPPNTWEMVDALGSSDLPEIAAALRNDLERPALAAYPDLAGIKRSLLDAGCLGALLCGSGSAIFGLAEDLEQAERIISQLVDYWPWVRLVPSVREGNEEGNG